MSGHGLSLSWGVSAKPMGAKNGALPTLYRLFSKDTTPLPYQKTLLSQKPRGLDALHDIARSLQRGLAENDNAELEDYLSLR